MPETPNDLLNVNEEVDKIYISGQEIFYPSKLLVPVLKKNLAIETLVADKIHLQSRNRVYFIGCGNGLAPVAQMLNNPHLEMWITEFDYSALSQLSRMIQLNNVPNIHINPRISLLPDCSGVFDTVIVYQPKGRKLSRRLLAEAFYTLRHEGELYIVGSNDLGIRSATKDLQELMNNHTIVAYKKGNRLVKAIKESKQNNLPPWMLEPGIQPGSWICFDAQISGEKIQFYSLPGVFSADRVDKGSSLLIDNFPVLTGMKVMDFGCGYGIIGIAASLSNTSHVDMIDSNSLAIASSLKNVNTRECRNISVMISDGLSAVANQEYHYVITNPPFHVARDVDYSVTKKFLVDCHNILYPQGKLLLVANQFIRYDELMMKIYSHVQVLAFDKQYRVWLATK